MYCNRCKTEKTIHLFPPSVHLESTWAECSKCTAERNGNVAGGRRWYSSGTPQQRSAINHKLRDDDLRKQARQAETQRLCEARKKRLALES